MKANVFLRETFHFFRNALIMTIINMIIVYLISRLTNLYNSEGYGRIMILYGCFYMLLGFGSLIGGTKLRYGEDHISCFNNLSASDIKRFAAGEISKIDNNFNFTLHSAFTGAAVLVIGLIIFNS